jgi:hypothetical protein
MAQHVLDLTQFRLLFPAFADTTKFPDVQIEAQWIAATGFLGEYDGCLLSGAPLQLALNYMTAHLLQSWVLIMGGGAAGTVGVITGATVDKVQVQMSPPPIKSGFQFWLATTPYGLYLWALLSAKSAGGFYIGGLPERRAFRKVGGTFGP